MVIKKYFYKSVRDGYIEHVGFGYGSPEITEDEYQMLRETLLNAPETGEGQEARLREDLTWEIKTREEYERIMLEQEVQANGNT